MRSLRHLGTVATVFAAAVVAGSIISRVTTPSSTTSPLEGWGVTLGSNEPYSLEAWIGRRRGLVDAYGTARLAAKDAESAIIARIGEDFNLTPVLARAHYEQMARYFSEYGAVPARPGELCYLAVDAEEPPGKAIVLCRKVQVRLELTAPEDLEALRTAVLPAGRRALAEPGLIG
jgi:hypothetical protein